jgi:hypothetical protein
VQRHDVDPVSLTFGLIFLGIANAWLMVETGAAEIDGLRWFFPVLLLGAGAAGVVSSLLRGRRSRVGAVVDSPEGHP